MRPTLFATGGILESTGLCDAAIYPVGKCHVCYRYQTSKVRFSVDVFESYTHTTVHYHLPVGLPLHMLFPVVHFELTMACVFP
ncbi:hypothetical protein EDB84DRAFT_1452460 [Lactarius hengduanensis]|nr:hypothetical protein EDB84DRAFT_1452460 [Lactarius hengduanensis]